MTSRKLRVIHPKGLLFGTAWRPAGTVIDVTDDRRARELVEAKHCEYVAAVPSLDPHVTPVERGTAPRASERAARR